METDIKHLNFRTANHDDILAIMEIHNSNVRGENISHDYGFLLAQTNQEEIQKKINKGTLYFVAVDINNQKLGFVAMSQPKISSENHSFFQRMIWNNQSYQSQLLGGNHFYIQTVATKPEYMGKGIGQFMYKSIFDHFPNHIFSAFIVSKPIFNDRSVKFHQKQGFVQVAKMQLEQFLDMQNYETILMVKENI